ncbi:unnamed protein product [Macrosiphum euphorbiae]|uniref:Uncharacterized protein n=1 Tax=Macrosiphum euphorbiae TaxID=13131 RepID=A0AAV0W5S6_9HEMI|nr:unnamed protein product [Macrosiphum euphorbiae]
MHSRLTRAVHSGRSGFMLIVLSYSDWSVLFVCLQQCGGHGKEVDYSWTRQTAMKQGYEAKMNNNDHIQQLSKGTYIYIDDPCQI